MSRLKLGISSALVGIVGAFGFFFISEHTISRFTASDPSQSQDDWLDRINDVGSVAAHTEFAQSVEGLSSPLQHTHAHVFGAALFAREDSSGLSVCDGRFVFGCAHEVIAQSIARYGTEIIPALGDICERAAGRSIAECSHGIGHGVLGYIGYGSEDLTQALEHCRVLAGKRSEDCAGGVFMEYNLRTLAEGDSMARPYEGNPYAPCDAVDAHFAHPCMFWISQWWVFAFREQRNDENMFAHMGKLCRQTAGAALSGEISTCFEGLGYMSMHLGRGDIPRMVQLCHSATKATLELESCLSMAAKTERVLYPQYSAVTVCESLEKNARTRCEAGLHELDIFVQP